MTTHSASSLRQSTYLSSDECRGCKVVAAIDFGTSNSGYAFTFRDSDSAPNNLLPIQLNKWETGYASSSTEKEPTTVLLNPEKKFNSFGYKAETTFARLCDQRKNKGWWFFQNFKMILHKRKISRDETMKDEDGNSFLAIEVFSIVISHLKDCILRDVRKQNADVQEEEVLYVLTVPAIWSDAAKQFMREAATAEPVGIKDKQLNLVLEPEAASVYCRQTKCRIVREPNEEAKLDSLAVGQKYIILDLGGGTADIASHVILDGGKLCELNNTQGNDVAGSKFNKNFLEMFNNLLGKEFFSMWRKDNHSDYLELQRKIEGCKKEDINAEEGVYITLPNSLVKIFENKFKKSIKLSKYREQMEFSRSSLYIKAELFRGLFDSVLKELYMDVEKIIEDSPDIGTLFLVGGLPKSKYICESIQSKFQNFRVVVPVDPGLAVLKGAVMLGDCPQIISSRLAKYFYGVEVHTPFVKGQHKDDYKCTLDGEERCKHIYRQLIEKGAKLEYGQKFRKSTYINAKLPETKKTVICLPLFQSEHPAMYTKDEGCTCIGRILMYPPDDGWPDHCKSKVTLVVGEAEFKFYSKDGLGRKFEIKADFL